MEINLNSSVKWSNVETLNSESQSTKGVAEAKGANVAGNSSLGIQTSALDVLKGSEPVSEVPEGAIRRDDALGNLVNSAFNLAPPPMPSLG